MEKSTSSGFSVSRSGRVVGRERGGIPPRNTAQTRHPPTTSHLPPTSGITSLVSIERWPLHVLSKGSMDADLWYGLLAVIRKLKCACSVKIWEDRIELDGQIALDLANQIHLKNVVEGMLSHGHAHQACSLLLMCTCETRVPIFLGIEREHLQALRDHDDKTVRELFDKALLGALEHASRLADRDPDASKWHLEQLQPCCSSYLLARLALWCDDLSGFWKAYANCSDEQKQGLMPLVPQAFGTLGQIRGLPPTSDLFAWVRRSIEAAFNTGPSQGLDACEHWLDRMKEWGEAGDGEEGDPSLRCALVRSAVAHALAEHAASKDVSSQSTDGLLDRAWAGELTLPVLDAVPAPYRERLLSAAVERAANAATTQALHGLVSVYLALYDDPRVDLEDCRWLGECLTLAFKGLLAPDSGRNDVERSEIRDMSRRMDRGLSEQCTEHLKDKRYAAAVDCIGELVLLAGPSFEIERFTALMGYFSALLGEVGLGYGLVGDGLHIYALPEASDKGLQDITRRANELAEQIREAESQGDAWKLGRLKEKLVQTTMRLMQERQARPMQQRLALERLLSLLARCGLGEIYPLEARVREYLEKEALPLDRCDEKTSREIRIHRVRTQLMVQSRRDWRVGMGPLWKTRQWLDQLIDLGAYGRVCLRDEEPLRTAEFGQWRDLMTQGGKASPSHALLVSALAAAMDGERGDPTSMTWLFDQFADGVDLQSVLMSMPPPVQGGGSPASGVDRFLHFARRLADQGQWLRDMEDTRTDRWQPGWKELLDFCRFLAKQPQRDSQPMDEWFARYASNFDILDNAKTVAFLKPIWLKDLVNGVACAGSVHELLMRQHQTHGNGMDIGFWEGAAFKELLSMVEPHLVKPSDGSSQEAWVRHNLAKGLVRDSEGLWASRIAACPRPGFSLGSQPPFAWKSHWASALVSAYRDILSQPQNRHARATEAEHIAALWSGAAKAYPAWLDKKVGQGDAVWVKAVIGIFESKDIEEDAKRERLNETVAQWREALLGAKAL